MSREHSLRVGDRIDVKGVVTRVAHGVATIRLETGEHLYMHLARICEACGKPLPLLAAAVDYGTENYEPCPCRKEQQNP